MKKNFKMSYIIIIVIIIWGAYNSFMKETKLGLDLKGGVYAVLEADLSTLGAEDTEEEAMKRLISVIERRINALGVSEPIIQQAGVNRVIVELAGEDDPQKAIELIGTTALMEFKLKDEEGIYGETLMTGSDLKKAAPTLDEYKRPVVSFELNIEGAQKFAEITRKENRGKTLAILIDGVVQTEATINEQITGGRAQISGNYNYQEAQDLATLLNAGALPVKAEIIETRVVGASLGEQSIADTAFAAVIAVTLIAIFMVLFYRLPGFIASIVLVCFGLIAFGSLNYIGATLTLPGIAGLILSLGMAVDANVIIFERIKEELRYGNRLISAVNAGFSKAFSAIMDANVTTLIITTILFSMGTGSIKGFAITLSIGIFASMISAIFITKMFLTITINTFKIQNTSLFGVRRDS